MNHYRIAWPGGSLNLSKIRRINKFYFLQLNEKEKGYSMKRIVFRVIGLFIAMFIVTYFWLEDNLLTSLLTSGLAAIVFLGLDLIFPNKKKDE